MIEIEMTTHTTTRRGRLFEELNPKPISNESTSLVNTFVTLDNKSAGMDKEQEGRLQLD
jgi:hypothetical protein